MARRRMISENIILDEEFNSLSVEAQNIFLRLLAVSDDFGVVPANLYTLDRLINTPPKIDLAGCLEEIRDAGLGYLFLYNEKPFFIFKMKSFDEFNSYLISKRTKSEYLKEDKDFMLSDNFQEILGSSREIAVWEIKDKSNKIKDIRRKKKDSNPQIDESFNRFWERYPKKVAKLQAYSAFKKINPDNELLDKILSAVDAQVACGKLKAKDQYTKHPATWLNSGSWEDVLDSPEKPIIHSAPIPQMSPDVLKQKEFLQKRMEEK